MNNIDILETFLSNIRSSAEAFSDMTIQFNEKSNLWTVDVWTEKKVKVGAGKTLKLAIKDFQNRNKDLFDDK